MSDLSESEKEIRRKYFQEYYSRNKDTILTQQRQRRKNLKVDKEQQSSSSSSSPSSSSTDEEKPINLCEDQIQALIEIETFLSGHKRVFNLKGGGGTGKTSILANLVKMPCIKEVGIIFLTPTHKSAQVLRKSLQQNVSTYHSYFKFHHTYDKNGKSCFVHTIHLEGSTEDTMNKGSSRIIVCDECSMISDNDLKAFKYFLQWNEGNKIIFVGDQCQLFPINEILNEKDGTKSIVVNKLSGSFHTADDSFSLTKIKRTQNPDIKDVYKEFRQSTKTHDLSIPTQLLQSIRENKAKYPCDPNVFVHSDVNDFQEKMIESFKSDVETVVVCCSNKKVQCYSKLIHQQVYNNTLHVGQRLISTGIFSPEGSVEYKKCLAKNNQYALNCLCKYGVRIYTCTVMKITSLKRIENLEYNGKNFKGYEVTASTGDIDDFFAQFINESDLMAKEFTFSLVEKDELKRFRQEVCIVKKKVKKQVDQLVPSGENKRKEINALWKKFYDNVNYVNAPIEPMIALTTYKSQGSTYKNVFCDLTDINTCRKSASKFHEMYTAVTRASNKLHIHC